MKNQLDNVTREKLIEIENWKQKYEDLLASKMVHGPLTEISNPKPESKTENTIHHFEPKAEIYKSLSRTESRINSNAELFEKSVPSLNELLSCSKNKSNKRLDLTKSKSLVFLANPEDKIIRSRSLSLTDLGNTPSSENISRPRSSSNLPNVTQSLKSKAQNKNYVMNIKMKEFNSIPFRLGFFERLEYFANEHRKIHERHREKYQTLEKIINHKKLEPLYLVLPDRTSSNEVNLKKPLPAEFMPAPGSVPEPNKTKNAFTLEKDAGNLWGGRYKVQQKAKRLNVLNLFDISLNIPEEEQNQSEEDY